MKTSTLQLIGWFGVIGLLLVLLGVRFIQIPIQEQKLLREVQVAQSKREQRKATLTALDVQFKRDESRYAGILKRFPWLIESAGGTAFLTRLGEVVTGQSLKVLAIGALQRQATPEWAKVSRQIRLTGRFAEVLSLVENVERSRGVLQEVKIRKSQPRGGEPEEPEEIEAQFGLVTLELSEDIRKRLRASIAVLPKGSEPEAAEPGGPLLLPVPAGASPIPVASLRDPFQSPEAISATGVPGRTRAPGPGGLPPEEVFPKSKGSWCRRFANMKLCSSPRLRSSSSHCPNLGQPFRFPETNQNDRSEALRVDVMGACMGQHGHSSTPFSRSAGRRCPGEHGEYSAGVFA